jgi:hypothetical protein
MLACGHLVHQLVTSSTVGKRVLKLSPLNYRRLANVIALMIATAAALAVNRPARGYHGPTNFQVIQGFV